MKTLMNAAIGVLMFASCSSPDRNSETSVKHSAKDSQPKATDSVQRLDPRLDLLISAEAKIEVLASGFTWSEGPVWVPSLEAVVFTDVPENIAYKWSETDSLTRYLEPSGYTGTSTGKEGANGLLIDSNGYLVLCQHGDRRLARMRAPLDAPDETYETIVNEYEGKKFNSPNDLTQNSNGTLFFTDPPYGLKDDDQKELDFQGVYKVDASGKLKLLVDSLSFPNGIALSPDERTLYVAVSDPKKARYYAYSLDSNDEIINGKVLLDVTHLVGRDNPGLPDGLKVHDSGNLFATGPGGVLVISPEGDHLGTVITGQSTANCAFNEDQSELYMTADMQLLRLTLNPD